MPFRLFERWEFKCEECDAVCGDERAVQLGEDWYNPSPSEGWLLLETHPNVYRCFCPDHRERGKPVLLVEINPSHVKAKADKNEKEFCAAVQEGMKHPAPGYR